MRRFTSPVAIIAFVGAACSSTRPEPTAPTTPADTGTFTLSGDPASAAGATWSYRGAGAGVTYDLQGHLFKPPGTGPFPAVIISHGMGGSSGSYSRMIAQQMVGWGLVAIATNYTHAAPTIPAGSPGTAQEPGASQANVRRAKKTYDLLIALPYVDRTRIAAHGHSMGAYVTAAFTGSHPSLIRAATITGGGVRAGTSDVAGAAPVESQVVTSTAPYQIHHGELDNVVPLSQAQRLQSILQRLSVPNELHVYPGGTHESSSRDALMFQRVRAWYTQHGVL